MRRDVNVGLTLDSRGPARLVLAISAAGSATLSERFYARQTGSALPVVVLDDIHGGRLHVIEVDTGPVLVEYSATVDGRSAPAELDPLQEIRFLRPSVHCASGIG